MKKFKLTKIKVNNSSVFIIVFRIISVIIILIALFFLYKWHNENKENSSIIDDIQSQVVIPKVPDPIDYKENASQLDENSENKTEPEINTDSSNAPEIPENSESNFNSDKNYLLDFSNLNSINDDTVAWITVNNTKVNFPIVKSKIIIII